MAQEKRKGSSYDKEEKDRYATKLNEKPDELFDNDGGGGIYKNDKKYPHILKDGKNNFYKDIRDRCNCVEDKGKVKGTFKLGYESKFFKSTDNIGLHSPTDTVSSQVACLNHLFPIRQNEKAILAMLNNIYGKEEFTGLVALAEEGCKNVYVAFEVMDKNNSLKEDGKKTIIDAVLVAKNGVSKKNTLVVFEWKYTEHCSTGKDTYNKLIQDSGYLNHRCEGKLDKNYGVYSHDPFYQLMRQTLWAEKVIRPDEGKKKLIDADDYLHIHVIPKDNEELRNTGFEGVGTTLEETWKDCLSPEGKKRYKIITPKKLFEPLVNNRELLEEPGSPIKDANDYIDYLKIRYWQEK